MPSSACSAGEGSGLSVAAGFASGGGAAGFCSQGWGPGETAGFALGCGFFTTALGCGFCLFWGPLATKRRPSLAAFCARCVRRTDAFWGIVAANNSRSYTECKTPYISTFHTATSLPNTPEITWPCTPKISSFLSLRSVDIKFCFVFSRVFTCCVSLSPEPRTCSEGQQQPMPVHAQAQAKE